MQKEKRKKEKMSSAAPTLYADNIKISTATTPLAVSTFATNSSVNSAIAAIPADISLSTSQWTAAVTASSSTNVASSTIGTVTSTNSASGKYCTLRIPVSVTPSAVNTTTLGITITGLALVSPFLEWNTLLSDTNTNNVYQRAIVTTGTSNQYTLTFGANSTTAHVGYVTIFATHA